MLAWILLGIVVLMLAASLYLNWRLGKLVLGVEEAVEEALGVMDESYRTVSDLLETPVLMDSPEIRHAVFQIKRVRDSVLFVSNVLAEPFGGVEEVEEDTGEDADE